MPTVAEQLRVAREARKLTIQQVAERHENPHRPHPRSRRGEFQCVFRANLHSRLGEKLRHVAQARRAGNHGCAHRRTGSDGKIQRAAAVDGSVKHAARPHDVSALEIELEGSGWLAAAVLGIVLVIFFASFAWRHHKRSDPLAGLQPAVYQSANSSQTLPLASHH